MRINSLRKEKYDAIVSLLNKIKRLGAFKHFNTSNIIFFKSKGFEGAVTFATEKDLNAFGLSIFIGDEGFNCLYDLFTMPDTSINKSNYNLINVMYKKGRDLTPDDIFFLEKVEASIKKTNNIIPRTYKAGFASYYSTSKEADDIIFILSSLYVLLKNKMDYVVEEFSNSDKAIYVDINFRKLEYSVNAIDFPYIERKYSLTPATEEEISDFKNIEGKEYDFYVITGGNMIPTKIKECNKAVIPLMITFSTNERPLADFNTIVSLPKEYRETILVLIHDYIKENGLPRKIVFNNRYIYYSLYELFSNLGIEVVLQTVNESIDLILNDLSIAFYEAYFLGIDDQGIGYVEEDAMRKSASNLRKMFKAYNDGTILDDEVLNDNVVFNVMSIISHETEELEDEEDELISNDTPDTGLIS